MSALPLHLPLVLASTSPRRVALLGELGRPFEVVKPEVEEAHDASLSCEALTTANARLKALAGLELRPDGLVIGADTLVYVDDDPLGKPVDEAEAVAMLRRLSGRTHRVATGVALAWQVGAAAQVEAWAEVTEVSFRELRDADIAAYHALVHVYDKAGGYAVQEHGELLGAAVSGSWSNVVGLPLERLAVALRA